jgi:hypothetical protein
VMEIYKYYLDKFHAPDGYIIYGISLIYKSNGTNFEMWRLSKVIYNFEIAGVRYSYCRSFFVVYCDVSYYVK